MQCLAEPWHAQIEIILRCRFVPRLSGARLHLAPPIAGQQPSRC